MKKKKVIKRKISKIKKKNPKEPYYMRSVDLSGREENEGIDQLNIDMGDMYSITEDDLINLKRNYYECPNKFVNLKYRRSMDRNRTYNYVEEANDIFDGKYKPIGHVISYCSNSKCKTCNTLKEINKY